MSNTSDVNAPAVVDAFHHALRHQALLVLLVAALVPVAWATWRWRRERPSRPEGAASAAVADLVGAEAVGRRALRWAFGGLWVLDGLLQLQQSMPLGLVPKVVQPAAASSPRWVQTLVGDLSTVWDRHPVAAASAAVWIQLGIGAWVLAANRGLPSRLAGVAATAWAVVVWVGGNAFGGMLGSGVSWLTGAPGAVLLYAAAGVLVAIPEQVWQGPRLGRAVLRVLGAYLLGFAVLQAWPGRGFWQGGSSGGISSAVASMAATPQPGWLHGAVAAFGDVSSAHGWAVNLGAVVAMAAAGAGLLAGTSARAPHRLLDVAVAGTVLLCLADWVLVQDLGFLGGVGTDPNSMVPTAAVVVAAGLAATRSRAGAPPGVTSLPVDARGGSGGWTPAAALRVFASAGAAVVVLVGVVPMAAAVAQPNADRSSRPPSTVHHGKLTPRADTSR